MIGMKYLDKLQELIAGKVLINEPMKNHTTFRIGGPAEVLVIPNDVDDLIKGIRFAEHSGILWHVIGNGSNVLVDDKGVRGIVFKIKRIIDGLHIDGEKVIAGAGIMLPHLARFVAKRGLSGLEHVVGIPGTLGGAVVMNAGSAGHEISEVVKKVKVLEPPGNIKILRKEDLQFGHRYSCLQNGKRIVLEVELKLSRDDPLMIQRRMDELIKKRRKTQPLQYPSAGSVFKKPKGNFAGRLIEKADCKGMRQGDAEVSKIHANFIINRGNASSKDIFCLMQKVQQIVKRKFDVILEPEIILMGNFGKRIF